MASALPDLRSLSLDELSALAIELGEPGYRGEQLFRWVHGSGVRALDEMRNISKGLRARLAERATLGGLEIAAQQVSSDGTRKLRLVTADGRSIETVLIPDGDKLTQCISSQVGCALDCQFCATAKLGLMRNLEVAEIVDQVYLAKRLLEEVEPDPPEGGREPGRVEGNQVRRITNLVYMGMGEPLHNFDRVVASLAILCHELGANLSHRRITVSTVGLVPGIARLGRLETRPNLAISLNATTDEVRDEIMPINKRFPIARLLQAARDYPLERRRRITFEYVLLDGVNDTAADADRLGELLGDIRCKVNIIPWNPHPGAPYARPTAAAIETFQNRVKAAGLPTYLRTPRGDDIDAACGQLANRAREAGAGDLVQLR